jgi:DNA-binding LytR/AlgR family response regulator
METLKIGIVEDELLIAESIKVTLRQIGYRPTEAARNYADALKMIDHESPDLLLIDIALDGKQDGIDLAAVVNEKYSIPFIFLTANSDHATVNRAKEVKPYAYLVKPFDENGLYSSIEIAFNNYNGGNYQKAAESPLRYKDLFFVKEGDLFHKVDWNDVLYVQSDNVYLHVHTAKRQYIIRGKLDDLINDWRPGDFFQVHRSYAINLKYLETINSLTVKVGGKELPLNKIYKQQLLNAIQTIK